uniref:Cbp1 family collagen-binding glycoprotein adhesin n=1 Tax=Prevotella sp. TaxID=59823 RepID=UPI004028C1FF
MKLFKGFIALFVMLSIFSCKNEKVDMSSYIQERDSIMQENIAKTQQLDELNGVLATIATGLDSIAIQENILFTNKGRDGVMLNRQQIAANLKGMADILARQRAKIKILQDSLANKKSSQGVERLQKVVDFLNQQLAEKDQVIQSLRADLNNSKKDITQLRSSLSAMRTKANNAEQKTKVLSNALSKQDEIINECYVKIGTKKQLSAAGLLKGGFLQKKKINYEYVDKSKFNAVDIRKFREIPLRSSNPKILTPQPSNRSFHFEESGDGNCTLVITNPTLFWSVSNFLIIQL